MHKEELDTYLRNQRVAQTKYEQYLQIKERDEKEYKLYESCIKEED